MAYLMVVASNTTAEPMEEDEAVENKELDTEEGSSTEGLVLQQAPAPQATIPAVPAYWALGPKGEVDRRGLAASSRARGKVPAI